MSPSKILAGTMFGFQECSCCESRSRRATKTTSTPSKRMIIPNYSRSALKTKCSPTPFANIYCKFIARGWKVKIRRTRTTLTTQGPVALWNWGGRSLSKTQQLSRTTIKSRTINQAIHRTTNHSTSRSLSTNRRLSTIRNSKANMTLK